MGLYQNIRPKTLQDVMGNTSTISSLQKFLQMDAKHRPHALLFKGPSGCGKTTLARILATELKCDPMDLLELDAANTRGIDSVRDVLKQVSLRPFGVARVIILDESHQLTAAAQEALLKSLEDCPDYCYFIICTTEPDHMIKTIRNRVTEYEVSLLGKKDISDILQRACVLEGIEVESDLLEGIAEMCEGSPRNALVFLDQTKGMELDEAFALLVAGTEDDPTVIDLCKKLSMFPDLRKKNWKDIIGLYNKMSDDPEKIRRSILGYMWRQLTIANDQEEAEEMAYLLRLFSTSVYYGGKAQLGALIARACFDLPKF